MSLREKILPAVIALLAAVSVFAQSPDSSHAAQGAMYGVKPWTGGASEDAAKASRAGSTIPMSSYSILATKDSSRKARTGTIVGTSPFAGTLSGSTIKAVVVPVIVNIGSNSFNPTLPNTCFAEGGNSAVGQFMVSPLVLPVSSLSFNGVNVGNLQYVDGSMRAEFWNTIDGSAAYTNPIQYSTAAPIQMVVGNSDGMTINSGCTLLGIVTESAFNSWLSTQMQSLTASGVISPTSIALFLLNNVTLSLVSPPVPPGVSGCCLWGYHGATGSTPQVYAVMDYDTSTVGPPDTAVSAHEIGELMNDPLVSNSTPAWGGVGSVPSGSCQGNLEVGDPLVGHQIVVAQPGGYPYHMVEFAFFSWFFNSSITPSLGAGGKFSSNGMFTGPAKACPPGGTY